MQPKPWLGAEFLLEFVFAGEIFLSFRDRCSSAVWLNRIKYRECPQIRSNMVFKWSSTYVATRSRSQLVQSGGFVSVLQLQTMTIYQPSRQDEMSTVNVSANHRYIQTYCICRRLRIILIFTQNVSYNVHIHTSARYLTFTSAVGRKRWESFRWRDVIAVQICVSDNC